MKKVTLFVFAVLSVVTSASVLAHCTEVSIGTVCCTRADDGGYDCELN